MYTKLPNGQIIYAEDIECVVDPVNGKGGIFIGNLEASQNLNTLKKHGIKAVLTAAKGISLNHPKSSIPLYLQVPGQDRDGFDLSKFFPQSISFIKESLEKTNILVHCLAGVSRSVSLVIAYLIKCKEMSYDSAYKMLKARRKIIHPNEGFISQLRRFEAENSNSGLRQEYRGYSSSPTKKRQFDISKIHEEDYYRSRVDISPQKNRNYNYQSPTKNYQMNYQSHQPGKLYSNYNNPSRVRRFCSYNENKEEIPKYNPEDYLSNKNLYSDLKQDDRKYKDFGKSTAQVDYTTINDELDEKIARIRQKYAEYAQIDTRGSPKKSRDIKFNNYFNQNNLNGDLLMKKTTSNYEYGMKRNYQRPAGLGLRKLNSMQDH